MKKKTILASAILLAAGTASAAGLLVNGAGATFPYPLYSKWFSEYGKIRPDLKFNYQSIGSGGGVQQVTNGTVHFGASDAPLTEEEQARIPDVLHVPTVLGAVVVTYNAPMGSLKLTPDLVAGIFLGKIARWNDPAIAALNPGTALPARDIAVIHRSDGSGTTAVFTDYLAKVSPEWKGKVGAGKSVKWPAGLGAKGNEGVTGLVKQTPDSIGYVELAYATQNKLPLAALRNREGAFVTPSIAATSAAAVGVAMPADFRVSITDAPGRDAWPIASFTYILVHREQKDAAVGQALVDFLWWAVHGGQVHAQPLDYAPLPAAVVAKVEAALKGMTIQGKPVSIAAK